MVTHSMSTTLRCASGRACQVLRPQARRALVLGSFHAAKEHLDARPVLVRCSRITGICSSNQTGIARPPATAPPSTLPFARARNWLLRVG